VSNKSVKSNATRKTLGLFAMGVAWIMLFGLAFYLRV
jgi:hypothetical protein